MVQVEWNADREGISKVCSNQIPLGYVHKTRVEILTDFEIMILNAIY